MTDEVEEDPPTMDPARCGACKKKMAAKQKAVRVEFGNFDAGTLSKSMTWAYFHRSCFEESIKSQELALQRIRKIAKKSAKAVKDSAGK